MEQTKINTDWRDNVSEEPPEKLKIADKETVEVTFQDEGRPNVHKDFGESIIFKVNIKNLDDKDKILSWYVNPQNYTLLNQLKKIGDLTGKKVKVHREGSTKSDTRYTIEAVE